jgi:hypothetical protein
MAAQFRARAVLIHGASNELLARSALAGDEHGYVLRRHAPDGLADLQHGRARAEKVAFGARLCHLVQDHGAAHPLRDLEGLADDVAQLAEIERLVQVVEGALLHGLDHGVGRLGSGDEDHGDARVDGADPFIHGEPGLIGQTEVEEDDVGRRGQDSLYPVRPRRPDGDTMPWRREGLRDLLREEIRVVVDEQDLGNTHPGIEFPGIGGGIHRATVMGSST